MNDVSLWLPALVFVKLLLYLALSTTLGGLFLLSQNQDLPRLRHSVWRYVLWGCGLGLLAAISQFFLQTGQFADSGLAGMWDSAIMGILWNSPIGTSLQIYAITWLLIGILLLLIKHRTSRFYWLLALLALVLPIVFTLTGHTAEQSIWIRIILYLHAVIALWWMGSLFPLWRSCKEVSVIPLQRLMHRFGVIAAGFVPLLLVAGITVAYQLTGSIENLLNSTHGQWLLLKVLLVMVLLGLAALHKFRLVPQLRSPHVVKRLQRSISIEMAVGLLVLLVTSLLSTAFGPVSMV